jgi:hypothetical protein
VPGYHAMRLFDLARRVRHASDEKIRWKLVWEFLEEYRWEPKELQPSLLQDEPALTGHDSGMRYSRLWPSTLPPSMTWRRLHGRIAGSCASRSFPPSSGFKRVDALVWAPAAFRKHGVYLSVRDLEAA